MQKLKQEQLAELQKKIQERAQNTDGGDNENEDLEQDIDTMPDCRLKYDLIVKRARKGMGKFEDA